MYKVKCYDRYGNSIETQYFDALDDAAKYRIAWADKYHIADFSFMPTIWKLDTDGNYIRMMGY